MDALILTCTLFLLGVLLFSVGLLTSTANRRRAAAWLLASARAMEEKRAAARGIDEERRLYQEKLERQFGCAGKDSEIAVYSIPGK